MDWVDKDIHNEDWDAYIYSKIIHTERKEITITFNFTEWKVIGMRISDIYQMVK